MKLYVKKLALNSLLLQSEVDAENLKVAQNETVSEKQKLENCIETMNNIKLN